MSSPSTKPIPLSAFDLEEVAARGGMGVVWKARHRESGERVAVKVLTAEGATASRLVHALHAEVAAMAGLRHPHIVYVFDYGAVPEETTAASNNELPTGSPWFAMEFVEGTTLSKRKWTHDWASLKSVLLDLLDSLAHAHARGVIHRDLKPSNVLMSGKPGRARLKLTDFGLAFAFEAYFDRTAGQPQLAGTPTYMAPEQVAADPSLQGPWTDLYNLGCIAWSLACGRRPYRHRDPQKLIDAHQNAPVPELRPRMDLPPGFDQWVYKLMAKRVHDRFHRAADAAWALVQLDQAAPKLARDIQASMLHTLVFDGDDPSMSAHANDQPPLPRTWRRREADPVRLRGAGTGLFGLRTFPVVGRVQERDALWRALAEVHRTRMPAAVVMAGPAGVGKSRLVEWLCRRAHEVGGAAIYRATHGEDEGPTHGLVGLLGRALQTTRVRLDLLETHLEQVIDRHGGPPSRGPDLARFLSGRAPTHQTEHHAIVEETIGWHADGRPAVLWIDDAHRGEDALRFAHSVLKRRTLPALIVVNVRDEELHEHDRERELLETLPGGRLLRVGPLSRQEMEKAVDGMLQLEPALRAQVVDRAAGNPAFAVELMRDWVDRKVLELGPGGFRVDGDAGTAIPSELGRIWARRIDQLLEGHPSWRGPLEIAACLGVTVVSGEWEAACQAAGVDIERGLLLALLRTSLAVGEQGTMGSQWHFAHGMLREAILQRAEAEGRLPALHKACAVALAANPAWVDRYGRHLLQAGETDHAVDALVQGAVMAQQTGAFSRAVHAASLAEDAMAPDDPRRRLAIEVAIRSAQLRGELEEALVHVRRLAAWSDMAGDLEASAVAARSRSEIALRQGRLDDALADAQLAVDQAADLGPRARAEAFAALGLAHTRLWKWRPAEKAFRDAAGCDNHLYVAAFGLGLIRLDLEHAHAALPLLERAAQIAHKEGDKIAVARFGTVLAQAQRILGNLDKAAALAEASHRALAGWGADGASDARVDLALTFMAAGRHRDALELLEDELSITAHRIDVDVVNLAKGVRFAAVCHTLDWERAGELKLPSGEQPGLSRAADLELVRLLHKAGDLALAHSQALVARDAWLPARAIYRRLGDNQSTAALTHALRGLPSASVKAAESRSSPRTGRRLVRRRDRDG